MFRFHAVLAASCTLKVTLVPESVSLLLIQQNTEGIHKKTFIKAYVADMFSP